MKSSQSLETAPSTRINVRVVALVGVIDDFSLPGKYSSRNDLGRALFDYNRGRETPLSIVGDGVYIGHIGAVKYAISGETHRMSTSHITKDVGKLVMSIEKSD